MSTLLGSLNQQATKSLALVGAVCFDVLNLQCAAVLKTRMDVPGHCPRFL